MFWNLAGRIIVVMHCWWRTLRLLQVEQPNGCVLWPTPYLA
jgi:hypothetical protein